MKKLIVAVVSLIGIAGSASAQTMPLYANYGLVDFGTEPPQIDATAFFNAGEFYIFSTLPFSTQNTRYFTNRGAMFGFPGWRLDYASPGERRPMASFVNDGIIEGGTYLLISATNVTGRGLLSVGESGLLKIEGDSVNLNRAGLRSGASVFGGGGSLDTVFDDGTNVLYVNASGITDAYWATGTNQAFDIARGAPLDVSNGALGVPSPVGPPHEVLAALVPPTPGNVGRVQVPINPGGATYGGFANTNRVDGSNVVIQVVFVPTSINNGEVTSSVRWAPGASGASVPIVEIVSSEFDTVLNELQPRYVYIMDDMLTRSNVFLGTNQVFAAARPVNYRVSTATPFEWVTAVPGNAAFSPSLIWNFTYSATAVTNIYSAYSFVLNSSVANVGGVFSRGFNLVNPFAHFIGDPTNSQGRVEIKADNNLDLRGTRMRGNEYLRVDAANGKMDNHTILDAPLISLSLADTSGALSVSGGAVGQTVERLSGQFYLWSARWTNQQVTFDFSDPMMVRSNVTTIRQHVMIVDPTQVSKIVDVNVTEFSAAATNITLGDPMRVARGFRLQGENVSILDEVTLVQEQLDLGPTNFSGVKSIFVGVTGAIQNPFGRTELGLGENDPLESFVNFGEWSSGNIRIRTPRLFNRGRMQAYSGTLDLSSDAADIGGTLIADVDATLTFFDADFAQSSISAGFIAGNNSPLDWLFGRLRIDIEGQVFDGRANPVPGGGVSLNTWSCTDGFELIRKPASGDFHGTRLTSFAPPFGETRHKWAGTDLGADVAGYNDNAALGTLTLDAGFNSFFTFESIDGTNALYVSHLELVDFPADLFSDLETMMDIEPGMKIYFGSSNRSASELNGLLNGRLVHLPLPGSASMTTVVTGGGQTLSVYEELLKSMDIDSDVDGVVNGLDTEPFDDIAVQISLRPEEEDVKTAIISWMAAPRTEYTLQYKNGLDPGSSWRTLTNFLTYSDIRRIEIQDGHSEDEDRYYRVIYRP